jgi:hypothetical protein
MTDAERKASAINWGNMVWDGTNVTTDVPQVLVFGSPEVRVTAPSNVAGIYQFGTAAYGPSIAAAPASGPIAMIDDGTAPTNDGCEVPAAGSLSGKIALVERGTCGFVVKSKNAQLGGAIGVIIYNNAANATSAPPGMAGVDATITIASVSLNRADGLKLAAELGNGLAGSLSVNTSVRAGADDSGLARLYAPNPVAPGSSGSHYDTIASRNLLMEPAINPDLTHELKAPEDLTLELLRDVGWFADADIDGVADSADQCSGSDLAPTVVIGSCDSGVPNTQFSTGCTISDKIAQIAASSTTHGKFVLAVTNYLNQLKKAGIITGAQKDAINSCAGSASIP